MGIMVDAYLQLPVRYSHGVHSKTIPVLRLHSNKAPLGDRQTFGSIENGVNDGTTLASKRLGRWYPFFTAVVYTAIIHAMDVM